MKHGFCSELFARFKELKTNHIVTIVLFSRVCYDEDEVNLVEGPLKKDPEFGWYKDFVSRPLFCSASDWAFL